MTNESEQLARWQLMIAQRALADKNKEIKALDEKLAKLQAEMDDLLLMSLKEPA